MERKLEENNMKEVWKGMKQITGCGRNGTRADGDVVRANQQNHFYNRFDDSAATATPTPPPLFADCTAINPTPPSPICDIPLDTHPSPLLLLPGIASAPHPPLSPQTRSEES